MIAGTAAALAALRLAGGTRGVARRSRWCSSIALIPANDLAVHALNELLTALLPPSILPKLDLQKHGIPARARTVVVVPTLFASVAAVEEALEHLEVQFLANRRDRICTSPSSATSPTLPEAETPEDDGDRGGGDRGVRALNRRYAGGGDATFYLFHRPRRWNPVQGVWMGWERKRGKLARVQPFRAER